MQTTVTGHAEIRAVLADPSFIVPPAPDGGSPGGIAWLRASVSRFSNGADHRRRRALAGAALAGVSAARLRRRAFDRTSGVLREAPVDLMARVARVVPVEVLAEALGIPAVPTAAVTEVARAYHPQVAADADADRAVARLVDACGGVADETTAARIGLLVQACDATAGLVGNAAVAMLRGELGGPVEQILAETLRHDPPVRGTRRLAASAARAGGADVAAGTVVQLDFAAANRDPAVFPDPARFDPARFDSAGAGHLTFGAGPRSCPGRDHALAVAAGIVEAVRDVRLAEQEIEYEPSANLRVPVRLLVAAR
jgi:cytochrome P450